MFWPENWCWKEDFIADIFNNQESESIRSPPISKMGAKDMRVWRFTKDGKYSVRSGYHFEMSRKSACKGESSNEQCAYEYWQQIWKHKSLVLFNNLFGRLVKKSYQLERICMWDILWILFYARFVCKYRNLCHAVWGCPAASDVWSEEKRPVQKWASSDKNVLGLWQKMVEKLKKEELNLVAMLKKKNLG